MYQGKEKAYAFLYLSTCNFKKAGVTFIQAPANGVEIGKETRKQSYHAGT
jgi:hypothetical protein